MVNKHLANLKYVFVHKWFVFIAGLKLDVPVWQLIIHDWTKLTLSEWNGYTNHFNVVLKHGCKVSGIICKECTKMEEKWEYAWLHHKNRNPHHWDYYATFSNGKADFLEIPEKYAREMVADWFGAGRAINEKWEAQEWYEKNKQNIKLAPNTKKLVEELLAGYN